jgi:dipeptidyl aminopeptidase/acylaminoacyl peptidase
VIRWFALALACALLIGGRGEAHPYTVEDMLDLQSLGNVSIDPSGRWLMIEVGRPYRDAPRFDNEADERMVLTQLVQVDLERPGPAKLAFDQSSRAGYISGPFSPSGRSMLVVRDQDYRTTLGVLDLEHRRVRWLGFGAERADFGETVVWLSDHQLLALAMPASDRPYRERLYDTAMQQLPGLWRRSARGLGPTDVLIGSGQYGDIHPADPMRRLVEVDLLTGRARTLAVGPFESLSLSATKRTIALVETTGRLQPDSKALITLGTPWQHRRVRLYDLATDRLSPQVQGLDLQIYGLRWSRTGDRLLAYGVDDRSPEASSQLWEIDAKAEAHPLSLGGLKLTLATGVLRQEPRFDWVGQDIVVYASSEEAKRSDWYRLSANGLPVLLTGALKTTPPALAAVMDGSLIFAADDGLWSVGLNGEARAQLQTSGLRLFSPKRLNTTLPLAPDAAPDGSQLAGVRSTVAGFLPGGLKNGLWANGTVALSDEVQPLAAWREGMAGKVVDAHGVARILVSSHGRKADVLTLNPQLDAVDFVTPVVVPHIGASGEALKSWLYLPGPIDPARPPPLVIMGYPGAVYSGPPSLAQPGVYVPIDFNAQLAVAHGYAVLIPSLPKEPGETDPGLAWTKTLESLIDAAAVGGRVDVHRTAFWGMSFGGFAALNLAVHSEGFAAIIADCAASDMISVRGEQPPAAWLSPEWPLALAAQDGWTEAGQAHLMATPWSDPDRYLRNSAALHADRIKTPLLIVEGDQDYLGVEQGREMFADLYRLDKDALFATFYGEGHGIVSPPNIRAYQRLAYGFLDDAFARVAPSSAALTPPPRPSLDGHRAGEHEMAAMFRQRARLKRRFQRPAEKQVVLHQSSVEEVFADRRQRGAEG